MHKLMLVCEILAGFLMAILMIPLLLIGMFVGLFELPHYLRIKRM